VVSAPHHERPSIHSVEQPKHEPPGTGITDADKQEAEGTPSPLAAKLRGVPILGHFSHNSTSQSQHLPPPHGRQNTHTVAPLGLPHHKMVQWPYQCHECNHIHNCCHTRTTTHTPTLLPLPDNNNTRHLGASWTALECLQTKNKITLLPHPDNNTHTHTLLPQRTATHTPTDSSRHISVTTQDTSATLVLSSNHPLPPHGQLGYPS